MGSIFHFGFDSMVAALLAAALPCATLYGISLGPWHAPATNMPSVGVSIGLSFGWLSMKKPSLPREMPKILATSAEPLLGMAAVQSTTISLSISIGSPRAMSSALT